MTWTLTTCGSAIAKAGSGISSVITSSGSGLGEYSDSAENLICGIARSDIVTNFSSLPTYTQKLLGDMASRLIAQDMISHDTSGYNKSREAELLMDINDDKIDRVKRMLEDDKAKKFFNK